MHDAIFLPIQHAQRVAGILPDLYWISSLTDDDLRCCWEFRRNFMGLKPHIDPKQDWEKYRRWVRTADLAWLPVDRKRALRSTFFYKVETVEHEQKRCVLIWPEYSYTRPDSRKSAGIGIGFVASLLLAAVRAPLAPQYIVGTGYVPSYLALCHAFDSVFLSEDPAMTEWERSLYRSLVQATPGYDRTTGVVEMGTIPIHPRTTPPSDPTLHHAWCRYLAQNPHWTDGYTCMLFARVTGQALIATAQRLAVRARLHLGFPNSSV